jgi:CTP synthase (UTP-ammonia lyase)
MKGGRAMTIRDRASSRVGIVGDFSVKNETHHATNLALAHAGLRFEWVPTVEVEPARPHDRLGKYAGLFIAPASPYESMEGALAAVRLARERGVPLVGT